MENNFKLTEAQARERVISEVLNPSTEKGKSAAAKWLKDHTLILDKAGLPKIAGVIRENEADYTYFFNVEDYDYFLKMTIGLNSEPYLEPSSSNKLVMIIDSKTLTLDQVVELSGLPKHLVTEDEEPYQDLPDLKCFVYESIIEPYYSHTYIIESFRKHGASFIEQKLRNFCHRKDVEQVKILLSRSCHYNFLEKIDISSEQVSFFYNLNASLEMEIAKFGPGLESLRKTYFPTIPIQLDEAGKKNLENLQLKNNIELTDEKASERVIDEILNSKHPVTQTSVKKWLKWHKLILDESGLPKIVGLVKNSFNCDSYIPSTSDVYDFFFNVEEYPYFLMMRINRHSTARFLAICDKRVAMIIDSETLTLAQVVELSGLPAHLLRVNETGSILYEPILEAYHPLDKVAELFIKNLLSFEQKLIDFCNRKDIEITIMFLRNCYYGMVWGGDLLPTQIAFFHKLNASISSELKIHGPGLEDLKNEENY